MLLSPESGSEEPCRCAARERPSPGWPYTTTSTAKAGCGTTLVQIAVDLCADHLVALEAQELDGPSLDLSAAVRPGPRVLEDGEEAAVRELLHLHDLELR